jgi:acyl-CoA thioester hydrolase
VPYRHRVRIRYGECDMQKVVFNANYLAYLDDATDTWVRSLLGDFEAEGFEFMIKKVTVEWHSSARFGEVLDLDLAVTRWGNASYDIGVVGRVGERPVLDATLVYVSLIPGDLRPQPVPPHVRAALGGPGEP